MAGSGVDGRSLEQEWALQYVAVRNRRSMRPAGHPVIDRLDCLVGSVQVDPGNSHEPRTDARLARAATTLALVGAGHAAREGRAFTQWLGRARDLACRELGTERLAWMSPKAQDETVWIADLFLVWGLVAQFGEPGGARLRKTAARALDSLMASERGTGGYGPGRGTFAATWLAAMTLECARAHAVKHRCRDVRGKGGDLRVFYDPDLADSAIRRATRFLDAYSDDDGLVSLPQRDQGWFSLGSAPAAEADRRLGPTAAVYLLRYLGGERAHRSARMNRAAAWIAAHLPDDWRRARRRDPLGMYAVPLFLVQTREYDKLRRSFMENHGRAPLRSASLRRRDGSSRASATSEPVHRVALAALANHVFYGASHLLGPR